MRRRNGVEHLTSSKGQDGALIHVYHWSPDYEIGRGVVHLVHGLSEHAGRYESLAEELTSEGYQVFAHDQAQKDTGGRSPAMINLALLPIMMDGDFWSGIWSN
jgi:dienelactone hydrolase